MANLIDILIPKVSAQADSIAQPTFGPIEGGGSSTVNASVLLSSTKTSVANGERFKVRIEIKTNQIQISEYRIVVDFDPSKLQAIDADNTVTGIQATKLDTVFSIPDPSTDNQIDSVGRFRYRAIAPSGQTLAVNTNVVEIEFQSQSPGTTPIKVITDINGTQLVRTAGVGLQYNSNELTIQISTQQVGTDTGGNTGNNTGSNTGSNTGNNTGTNTGTNTGNTGTNTGIYTGNSNVTGTNASSIPKTAIADDIVSYAPFIIGTIMIVLGSTLYVNSKNLKKKKHN